MGRIKRRRAEKVVVKLLAAKILYGETGKREWVHSILQRRKEQGTYVFTKTYLLQFSSVTNSHFVLCITFQLSTGAFHRLVIEMR